MLNIKVCKKENRYYRVSFAMLANTVRDKFTMGTDVDLDGRHGVVTGNSERFVDVLWTDVNEPEKFTYAHAVNTLTVTPAKVKSTTSTGAPRSTAPAPVRVIVNTGNARVDQIISKAVAVRMIEPDDVDVTAAELVALDEAGLDDYETSVNEFTSADVVEDASARFKQIDDDVELTEAEKALARTRSGGASVAMSMPKLSDFNVGTESRSLADVKGNKLDLMAYRPDVAELDLSGLGGDVPQHRATTAKRVEPKPMDNLRGLTKPIVQQTKQFEKPLVAQLSEALGDINWGKSRR